MHREGKAHGGIKSSVEGWFSDNATFAPEKFRKDAICLIDEESQMSADVDDFIASVRILVGGSSVVHGNFSAINYSEKKLPLAFLTMIEIAGDENSSMPKMSDFLKALEGKPVPPLIPADPPCQEETLAPEPKPKPAVAENTPAISIALPNGTVGKPYEVEPGKIARAIAAQRKDNPDLARIVHLQLPEDCGLTFDPISGAIFGTPTRSLEQQLHLAYISSVSTPTISCKVSLFINPDPASLWKDEPTNPDAPYQKESLDHQEYTFGHFRVVAASRRGRSHAIKGDFRDDDFAVGYSDCNGWLVVAVADGAGSAKYSRQGSRIAVTTACDRLVAVLSKPEYAEITAKTTERNDLEPAPPRKWFSELLYESALHAHYKIREEVVKPTQELPEPPTIRHFDTTLILLIMKKVDQGYFAATFSVGDGGAGIIEGQDTAEPLTHSDSGEHAGQTTFVTIASSLSNDAENVAKRFKMTTVLDFTAVLAMSDGITDPKFPSDSAFADKKCWHALWDELKPVVNKSDSLLEWMNFFSPGNHDDRTLVVVMPTHETATA